MGGGIRRVASRVDIDAYLASANASSLGVAIEGRVVEVASSAVAIGVLLRQSVNVVYRDNPVPQREDRLWLHFEPLAPSVVSVGLLIVRAAQELLGGHNEAVYALCDGDHSATAPRLLSLCGFEPTVETWGKDRIWLKLPR